MSENASPIRAAMYKIKITSVTLISVTFPISKPTYSASIITLTPIIQKATNATIIHIATGTLTITKLFTRSISAVKIPPNNTSMYHKNPLNIASTASIADTKKCFYGAYNECISYEITKCSKGVTVNSRYTTFHILSCRGGEN